MEYGKLNQKLLQILHKMVVERVHQSVYMLRSQDLGNTKCAACGSMYSYPKEHCPSSQLIAEI